MEPKILRLGSIYFNDNPVEVGAIYKNEALSLGDTVPGRELQWVDDGGYLIADRCICVNISQKQVLEHGFLLGIPVRIDSRAYLCRCLKVGDKPQRPNEWDDLLLKYGDADDLWHWKDQYFIGQESCLNAQNFCTVRGGNIANDWNTFGNGYRAETIGFRPLLKPLPPSPILDNSVIGKWVKVYGPQRISFGGKLVAFDDYDIVLVNFPRLQRRGACNCPVVRAPLERLLPLADIAVCRWRYIVGRLTGRPLRARYAHPQLHLVLR